MPTAVEAQYDLQWRTIVSSVRPMTKNGLEPCLPIDTNISPRHDKEYRIDPASANIVLPIDSLKYFAAKYLQGCTPVTGSKRLIVYFKCRGSMGDLRTILSSLAFEINSWRFILEPRDYIDTFQFDANQVLLGNYEPGVAGRQLGAPFLRKFLVYTIESYRGVHLILCALCEEAHANATNVKPIYENAKDDTQESTIDSTNSANQGTTFQPSSTPLQTAPFSGGLTPLYSM